MLARVPAAAAGIEELSAVAARFEADLLTARAQTHEKLEEWDLAEETFRRAAELDPQTTARWSELGRFLESRQQWEPGIAAYTKFLELDSNAAFIWRHRGVCYRQLRRWDEALADYGRAIDLRGDSWKQEFQRQRAGVLILQGKWREAAADLQQAFDVLADETENWSAARDLALVQYMAGDLDAYRHAAEVMDQRIGAEMTVEEANWLVRVYTIAPGMITDVNRDRLLRVADMVNGGDRALVCYRSGDYEQVVRIASPQPGAGRLALVAALAEYHLGNTGSALALLQTPNGAISSLLAEDPDSPIPATEFWRNWSVTFSLQAEAYRLIVEPRLAEVNQTLEADPTNVTALLNRAALYHVLAKEDEALADYTRALDANPDLVAEWTVRIGADDDHDAADTAFATFLADRLLAKVADATEWTVLEPVEMTSAGGATLTLQPDGSILAGGVNPDSDRYGLVMDTELKTVTAMRLEALTDESLPRLGPGRGRGGNFVVGWTASYGEESELSTVTFDGVQADYSFPRFPISLRGWSIEGGQGAPHEAVYQVAAPIQSDAGFRFRIDMQFQRNPDHADQNLGRFRLSVTDDPAAFERQSRLFEAQKLTDPWAQLEAARALAGGE